LEVVEEVEVQKLLMDMVEVEQVVVPVVICQAEFSLTIQIVVIQFQ
jgi:hypothetical protein